MRYQAVIFDFDGTLFNTEQNELSALDGFMVEVTGAHAPKDKLMKVFGMTGMDGLKYLGCTQEQIASIAPRWNQASLDALKTTPLFDGMLETLQELRAMGIRRAIVTSRGLNGVQLSLESRKISDYFDTIVCQKDTVEHKPHPAPLLECLRRMELAPQDVIYVGDSAFDMQCAQAAGADSGLALWGTHEPELPCTYRLNHPKDLLAICK